MVYEEMRRTEAELHDLASSLGCSFVDLVDRANDILRYRQWVNCQSGIYSPCSKCGLTPADAEHKKEGEGDEN